MEDECVFCKIVRGEVSSEKILEDEDFIVIRDINPKVEDHSLVISKEHYETFSDMPPALYEKFLNIAKLTIDKLGSEDYNMIMNNGKVAGQLVSHVHLHILPRKEGDGFLLNV